MDKIKDLQDLNRLIKDLSLKGNLSYAGEVFGLGKIGDINLNYIGREIIKEIRGIIEDNPEFIIPEPIKDLLSGKCYEGIFEDLKKEGII